MKDFRTRLAGAAPVLLDGATGTELNRRGVDTGLPLWSAGALLRAPEVLRQVHADYAAAGAEVLTANTFRTHSRSLEKGGLGGRSRELTRLAVTLAREAAGGRAWVAGSQAPLEDCYEPSLVPDDASLAREHGLMAEELAGAGVDLILVETQNTAREAKAAARAAAATGLPFLASFVCGSDARLLSGEALDRAAETILPFDPAALLVNCLPATSVEEALRRLRSAAGGIPIGAYANMGRRDPVQGWVNAEDESPGAYAALAARWVAGGGRLVGGCCGTTPAHILALALRLGR